MMRHALWVVAAVSWTTAIVGMFTGFDDHWGFTGWGSLDGRIWIAVLSVAIVSTVLAAQQHAAAKAMRTYAAVRAVTATRPPADGPPTGPMPVIRAVPPYKQHGPRAS